MAEDLQNRLQQEVDKLKAVEKEYYRTVNQRTQLESQKNENEAVKEELDLLEKGAEVYKLIGPVLVKQGLEDAKQNVAKRLDYINGELKRSEQMLSTLEEKTESQTELVKKINTQLQQLHMKSVAKVK